MGKEELKDKIIPMWLIVYDSDPDRSYIFTNKEKVIASIMGSLESSVPQEDLEVDDIVSEIMQGLDKTWGARFTALRFFSLLVFIHRLDLDRHNKIISTLMESYNTLRDNPGTNDELAARIFDMFIDPATAQQSGV